MSGIAKRRRCREYIDGFTFPFAFFRNRPWILTAVAASKVLRSLFYRRRKCASAAAFQCLLKGGVEEEVLNHGENNCPVEGVV